MLGWRLRWHGRLVGDVTDSQPKFPTGDAWVVFGDNKVGYVLEWRLRWRGEEVGDVTDSQPKFPTGDAWAVFGDKKRDHNLSSLSVNMLIDDVVTMLQMFFCCVSLTDKH